MTSLAACQAQQMTLIDMRYDTGAAVCLIAHLIGWHMHGLRLRTRRADALRFFEFGEGQAWAELLGLDWDCIMCEAGRQLELGYIAKGGDRRSARWRQQKPPA